jgi:tetratricopeptide (TPR) repeat protein
MHPFTGHAAAFTIMVCLAAPPDSWARLKSGPTAACAEPTAACAEQQAAAAPAAQQQPRAQLQQVYQEGERALAEGRYDDAARAYEELRKADPTSAELHARLGMIYFQQSKFAEAVPVLQRAVKLKPALTNAAALLAMCLSELGKYEEALPGLKAAFRQSQDPALKRMAGLHLIRANTFLDRPVDAAQVALDLARAYPKDPEVLYHTGRIFANLAYVQTMTLSQVAPQSIWLHQAAGEANESEGAFDAAVHEYRQVLAMDPRRPGIHYRTGRALLARAKQPDADANALAEAAQEFEQELQIDPTNANAAYELGELQRKANRLDEAQRLFQLALTSDPEFQDALVGLGRTLVSLGQAQEAIPFLDKAVALDPRDSVAVYQLAQAHRALGHTADVEKALAQFQQLRQQKQERERAIIRAPTGVTPQELDTPTPQ